MSSTDTIVCPVQAIREPCDEGIQAVIPTAFHRGYFAIESLGTFEFNAGRISLHGLTCRQRLRLARQINLAVRQLGHRDPLPDM
ncbi:DUF1107 family protein [Aeromonas veronii]|uniref:DUF1107 family protein n=1 Tax=Aeromonas veronii TaxID=654 RepID=UPI0038D2C846